VPHRIIRSWYTGLAVDGWAVTFGTARRRLLLAVPNVTSHPSTASVPMLYNGPLLCGFNVAIKGFIAIQSSLYQQQIQ